jgi:hypothetical protein
MVQKKLVMRIEKPEKLVGYALLAIGLVVIFISIIIAILMLLGNMALIEYIPKPVITGSGSEAEVARAIADLVPLFNIIPSFLLLVVLIYAGSVLTGKGIGLIKEINWKVIKATEKEVEETEPTRKPTRRATKEEIEKE